MQWGVGNQRFFLRITALISLVWLGTTHAQACAFDLELAKIPACVDALHEQLLDEPWIVDARDAAIIVVGAEDYRFKSRAYFADAAALPDFRGEVVLIEGGHADFLELTAAIGRPDLIDCSRSFYCDVRAPIWVETGASLTIDGKGRELRLHRTAGVFFKINGSVFIESTIIRAVEADGITPAAYVADEVFRPFFSIYGSGDFKARRSALIDLGYASPNAQGLSVSVGRNAQDRSADERPSLTLINSDVQGLFYGLYTHGAQPVHVIGNHFVRNIRYGIDPHDYSRDLVIARNVVTGTAKDRPGPLNAAHGIITSVAVNRTLIFDNDVFGNKGSGIVIDKDGHDTLIYNNRAYGNANNGLVLYESRDVTVTGNLFSGNERNGAHIRNSPRISFTSNRLENNQRYGLEAFTSPCGDPVNRQDAMTSIEITLATNFQNRRGKCKFEHLGALSLAAEPPMLLTDFCGADPAKIMADDTLAQRLATLDGQKWQSGILNQCP